MCIFLFFAAWAVDIPSQTGSEIGVGCVVRVQESAPVLVLDEQQYILRDDGKNPDVSSSDGIFSVFVSTTSQKKVKAALLGDNNTALWSGDIPFPPKGQQTWLLIDELQEGQRPLVEVKFKPISSAQAVQTSTASWWVYWLMIGIGMVLGWCIRRPNNLIIRRWSSKQSGLEHRVHIVDEQRELIDLVGRHARGMLVLLCTNKDRRHLFADIAKEHAVFLMDDDVPCERHSLLTQLSILENLGDAILILDGMYGLVKPLPSEASASVLHEILSASSHRVCVVFMRPDVPSGIEASETPHESTTNQ